MATKTRKIWTTEETALKASGEYSQSWSSDYSDRKDAEAEAWMIWENLTEAERKRRIIEVYADEVYEDEDGNEERKSWNEGAYDPILTIDKDTLGE